ncbi:hypothetical protein F5884DRAFT_685378 [Xylogone sp. PMI_703]|nr:hypothetical protein F5884DRAFT_685378 [Xylogone sp. PMI_703]
MDADTSGPFIPYTAIPGGVPTPTLDVPITACFLVLFILGAIIHFTLHHFNTKRKHKFHLSGLVFDFCIARILTCVMRVVWAFYLNNNSIILATLIFNNAGVVVLLAVNVVFTQRIIRAIHPKFGWNRSLNLAFSLILASIPLVIIYNIVFTILSFFTLDSGVLSIYHGLLLFSGFYTTILSVLPILLITPATMIPSPSSIENFATGRFRSKIIILFWSSAILFAGAIVRLIATIQQHSKESPGDINSKSIFYTTGFLLEIMVVFTYAIMRVDLRFWVPNGCKGPGDYLLLGADDKAFKDIRIDEFEIRMNINQEYDLQGWFRGLQNLPTRKQVREAIHELGFRPKIIGPPIDTGNSEILIYAFRVRKLGIRSPETLSLIPLRQQSWESSFSLTSSDGFVFHFQA